ncbi:RNA polymerase, sigma 28 subunit, FliA/WhiG subfamily [Rippkaea orientalis PCC 8801]|uniref:RNA polymerase, sigma 28 subunit, FliA/WhiG subfamily n=1 Tax=Rippkaea orientalis (strain PCC 8801 / RF-1) TaxID=41431 RepID=B7JVB8_RIPO1|nr:RNA polymerase sigma factor SigF [Rippkaea orientalis]ACK68251.1 RNA polymerase, sigma 28 subunit, FliA/WhiG subfamily [Rippkaea orientalis PCC 8801]
MYTPIKENLKLDTLRLFLDYQKTGSIQLRNQILELNFGLVRKEAYHWVNHCSESYEDLLQVGSLGLIRAIERFNSEKGHAFSSFALPYIRGEIQHYLRDKGYTVRIPRRWLEIGQQVKSIKQDFRERFNRQPTDSEIAQILEIPLKEWQEIQLAFQNREPLSLDLKVGNDSDGQTSLADLVPDPNYRSFQLSQEDQIRLQQGLAQLEERTRRILEFVFLQDLTQRETAEQLGISVVTVSRRVKKGLEILKQTMTAEIW